MPASPIAAPDGACASRVVAPSHGMLRVARLARPRRANKVVGEARLQHDRAEQQQRDRDVPHDRQATERRQQRREPAPSGEHRQRRPGRRVERAQRIEFRPGLQRQRRLDASRLARRRPAAGDGGADAEHEESDGPSGVDRQSCSRAGKKPAAEVAAERGQRQRRQADAERQTDEAADDPGSEAIRRRAGAAVRSR